VEHEDLRFQRITRFAIHGMNVTTMQKHSAIAVKDFYERLISYTGIHKIWGKVVYNPFLFIFDQPYFSEKHQIA
jgi:hypothetical protein